MSLIIEFKPLKKAIYWREFEGRGSRVAPAGDLGRAFERVGWSPAQELGGLARRKLPSFFGGGMVRQEAKEAADLGDFWRRKTGEGGLLGCGGRDLRSGGAWRRWSGWVLPALELQICATMEG